ncbi:Cyclic AMP-responsive element-binding protein 5 [Seiridium cupressi]
MDSVSSWNEPPSGQNNMSSRQSGPDSSVVSHIDPIDDYWAPSFPEASAGADPSASYYTNNGCGDAFRSPNGTATTFVSPIEVSRLVFLRQFITLTGFVSFLLCEGDDLSLNAEELILIAWSAMGPFISQHPLHHEHQLQTTDQHSRHVLREASVRSPIYVQTQDFHSTRDSLIRGCFPGHWSADPAGDNADANGDYAISQPHSHNRRGSKTSDARSTFVDSPDAYSEAGPAPHNTVVTTISKRQQQHERTRQKNRLAASRCREKTKKNADDLRDRELELSIEKQTLTTCAAELTDEVLALKHEIFRHANCDCHYIQKYLTTAASQIA